MSHTNFEHILKRSSKKYNISFFDYEIDADAKSVNISVGTSTHLKKDIFSHKACSKIKILGIFGSITFDDDIFEGLKSLESISFKNKGEPIAQKIMTRNIFKNLHNLKNVFFSGHWLQCLEPGCFDNLNLHHIEFKFDDYRKEFEKGIFNTISDPTYIIFNLSQIKNLKNCKNNTLIYTTTIEEYPKTVYQLHDYNKKQALEKVHEMIENNLHMSIIDYYWYENKQSLGYSRFCDFSVKN